MYHLKQMMIVVCHLQIFRLLLQIIIIGHVLIQLAIEGSNTIASNISKSIRGGKKSGVLDLCCNVTWQHPSIDLKVIWAKVTSTSIA